MQEVLFKGRLLKLARHQKKLPTGRTTQLEIIEHPGAALIIPFVDKNRVILLRQYRPVFETYLYEFPAGTIDPGEKALACAKREIVEETGFAAKKITRLGEIYPVPGYSTERIVLFKAEGLIQKEIDLDQDEIIEAEVYTKAQILKLFRSGKIKDGKSVCALAYCGWL